MTTKIEISKEKLIELYTKQNLSTRKIAKILGCEHTAIRNRLKEYKIYIRHPKKKITIKKEILEDFYVNKKLSTQKIAKILNISSCAVYYKLKESNIETRKKKIFYISKTKLEELYKKRRLSCSKIARKYKCNTVTIFEKLKKYSIATRDCFEANIKYLKKPFDGNNELKAYMIGFRLGDLNVKSESKNSTVIVKSSTTKEDQLNLIEKVYGQYGHFWVKKYDNVFSTMVFLDKSFNFLVSKEDKIDTWIMQNNNCFFAFLAGYTDAEGNISFSNNDARFRIRTYDKNILLQIYKNLNLLNINTKFGLASKKGVHYKRIQNKDCWGIYVYAKQDLLRLFSLIGPYLKHKKRQRDLVMTKNSILERIKKYDRKL